MAHALDLAAVRWPGEPRARLLLLLVAEGASALERDAERDRRRQAIRAITEKYSGAFGPAYLTDLRADWPE